MKWTEVLITQSCLILCEPMDSSPPGSSVHGILQARILVLPFPSPGDLLDPEIEPGSPTWHVDSQLTEPPEISALLCMGRYKSLGSLKSFLWCASQLSGASILCFLILRDSSGTLLGCMQQLIPRWRPFFVSVLSSLWAHHQGSYYVVAWWQWHPLFTDMADNILSSHS